MKRIACLIIFAIAGCSSEQKPQSSRKIDLPETKPAATKPAEKSPTKETKIYTREEFKSLTAGKTEEEVKKAIGQPNRVSHRPMGNTNITVWEYDGIVKDKDAKEIDESTWIWFSDWTGGPGKDKAARFTIGKKPR